MKCLWSAVEVQWKWRVSAKEAPLKCRWSAFELPLKCLWIAVEVPLKCRWSANSQQQTDTDTDLPPVTPSLSTVGWSQTMCLNNPWKKTAHNLVFNIWSSQANIKNTLFDQKSPWHPEVGVTRWHTQTDTQTDIQTDIRTWRLYYSENGGCSKAARETP